jgi:hypothetical protein
LPIPSRWLPSNYVVPLTDDEIAQLDEEEDEEELGGDDDHDDQIDSRSGSAAGVSGLKALGSQELYGSTPADGVAVDVHLYWVPRVRRRSLALRKRWQLLTVVPLSWSRLGR